MQESDKTKPLRAYQRPQRFCLFFIPQLFQIVLCIILYISAKIYKCSFRLQQINKTDLYVYAVIGTMIGYSRKIFCLRIKHINAFYPFILSLVLFIIRIHLVHIALRDLVILRRIIAEQFPLCIKNICFFAFPHHDIRTQFEFPRIIKQIQRRFLRGYIPTARRQHIADFFCDIVLKSRSIGNSSAEAYSSPLKERNDFPARKILHQPSAPQ